MYVDRLKLSNFRCFEKTEFDLNYPGREATEQRPVPARLPNVNVFIGGNGSGKTSAFRGIALGVLGSIISSSGFQAEYLVRRTADSNLYEVFDVKNQKRSLTALLEVDAVLHEIENSDELTVDMDGNDNIFRYRDTEGYCSTTITRNGDTETIGQLQIGNSGWSKIYLNFVPAFFLVGYGASRRSERPEGYSEGSRSPRYQRVASLFEEHVGLVPFTYGALVLKEQRQWEEACNLLNSLLPDQVHLTDKTDSQKRPLFDRDGVLLPFNALSDGFRSFVGWVWDLLVQLARLDFSAFPDNPNPTLVEIPGVVIVDEIDLFLHPEWQRQVIEKVATTFPKLQFLFSSHSPLVAGTLEPENLFVLEEDANGAAVVKQYKENLYGLTANQVLTSSYFGLSSTRAPGTGNLTDTAHRTVPSVSHSKDSEEIARRMIAEVASERNGA